MSRHSRPNTPLRIAACRNLGVAHRGPDGRDAHIPAIMAACGHAHGGTLLGGAYRQPPAAADVLPVSHDHCRYRCLWR